MRELIALSAAACSSAAIAASPSADSFVGPRAEFMVGYDATELPDKDGPEMMFGIRGGKDFASGDWRIGVELDVSRSNANRVELNAFEPGDRIHVRYGTDLYLGARPGRRLAKHVLAYGLAGGVISSMKVDYSGDLDSIVTYPGGPQPKKFSRPGMLFGFWTGGGLEMSVTSRSFIRTEYRYSNFHDGLYRHQGIVALGRRF